MAFCEMTSVSTDREVTFNKKRNDNRRRNYSSLAKSHSAKFRLAIWLIDIEQIAKTLLSGGTTLGKMVKMFLSRVDVPQNTNQSINQST